MLICQNNKVSMRLSCYNDQEKGITSSILIKVTLCNIDTDPNCKSHEYIENLLSGQSLYFTSIVVNNNIDQILFVLFDLV